jgi:hypothetical protein
MASWMTRTTGARIVPVMLLLVFASFIIPPASIVAEDNGAYSTSEVYKAPGMGLLWTRDSNLAGGEITWQQALDFVKQLNSKKYAGQQIWRLPSRDELRAMATLLNSNASQADGITAAPDFYWSATTGDFEQDYADAVNMADGSVDIQNKSDYNYVWPVCAGK